MIVIYVLSVALLSKAFTFNQSLYDVIMHYVM